MFSKALLVAAAIGAVSAQIPGLPHPDVVAKRQADDSNGLSPECQTALSAITPLYSLMPLPPTDLPIVTATDPCALPTFTGKALSEWNSYTSAAESFYSAHSSEYNSVATACADIAGDSVPVCTSAAGSGNSGNGNNGSNGNDDNKSGNDNGDSSNNNNGGGNGDSNNNNDNSNNNTTTNGGDNHHNAAARPTGTILAGFAAAALMGAVAML